MKPAPAVENAVKYARAAACRPAVIVFDHAFHGRSLLTMTMTAKDRPYKHGFGPFAPEVYRADGLPVPLAVGPRQLRGRRALGRLADLIDVQLGADAIACVVVKTDPGRADSSCPPTVSCAASNSCAVIRASCWWPTRYRPVSRTGRWFASEHEGIVPDLVVTAEGPGRWAAAGRGHRPCRCHGRRASGGIGGTYSGNPVACAAALGVFDEITSNNLLERARDIGDLLTRELREITAGTDVIGQIRGRGAMIAAELVLPGTTEPHPGDAPARIAATARTMACSS